MKILPCPRRLLHFEPDERHLQRSCQQRVAERVLRRFIFATSLLLLLLLLGRGTLHHTGFSWKTRSKHEEPFHEEPSSEAH